MSEWNDNHAACARVKEVLEQGGVPLELQVAAACKEFCAENSIQDGLNLHTEHVVYMPDEDSEDYREVDQRVLIYQESDDGSQMSVSCPIECKYRRDIEHFAFADEGRRFDTAPIFSDISGSQLGRVAIRAFRDAGRTEVSRLTSMKIKDGTPGTLYKENLFYNAAASLYDYIIFDAGSQWAEDHNADAEILRELGLLERFETYLKDKHYIWWSVLGRWINGIPDKDCEQYNEKRFPGGKPTWMLSAYLPIVCVNGLIHRTGWSASDGLGDFVETDSALMTIRKRGWPGAARTALLQRTAEVPVLVTHPRGLKSVLTIGLAWQRALWNLITNGDAALICRWSTQSAFFRVAYEHFMAKEADQRYRSDFDIEQYF